MIFRLPSVEVNNDTEEELYQVIKLLKSRKESLGPIIKSLLLQEYAIDILLEGQPLSETLDVKNLTGVTLARVQRLRSKYRDKVSDLDSIERMLLGSESKGAYKVTGVSYKETPVIYPDSQEPIEPEVDDGNW